ncbi:MAG TPA: HAD-IA family hydrolase [Bauldia sp.]|nr:HAD-IA family hydrolase [Bauldia sp.]
MRAVLFDKDGTLLDFEATWGPLYRSLALDLAEGDADRAAAMLAAGGLDEETGRMRSGSVLGAGTTADIVRLWYPDLAGPAFDAVAAEIDAAFRAHGEIGSVPVPGAVEVLAELAAMDFMMGVATNDATEAAAAAIAGLGLDEYLPYVFGYDSVPRPKPAPDIVFAFAAATGVDPIEVAVVGDNRYDMEMARAAGAGAAIGVLSGNSDASDLAPYADVILPSIRELPEWLAARKDTASADRTET